MDANFDAKLVNMISVSAFFAKDKSYQQNLSGFSSKTRNEIWEDIAGKLKSSPLLCKTRWTSLRDSYRKLRKKGALGGTIYKGIDFGFLEVDDNSPSRHTETIERCDENNSAEAEVNFQTPDFEIKQEDQSEITVEPMVLNEYTDSNMPQWNCQVGEADFNNHEQEEMESNFFQPQQDSRNETQFVNKVRKMEKENAMLKKRLKTLMKNRLDPTHTFFKAMAQIVSKLPAKTKAEIRIKVCTLVTNAEIQSMGE